MSITSTDIASLATAAVGLLGLFFTILNGRDTKTVLIGDASALKIIRIKRLPLDEKMWHVMQWRKVKFLIREGLLVVAAIILLILVFSLIEGLLTKNYEPIALSSGRVIAILIILFTYTFLFMHTIVYSYWIYSRSAENARFFVFQEADIQVEAEYSYLLNRCREALTVMHAKNIEIDAEEKCLEAYVQPQVSAFGGKMNVHIEPKGEHIYQLKISFCVSNTAFFLFRPLFPREEAESKAINHFIRQLMGKPEVK